MDSPLVFQVGWSTWRKVSKFHCLLRELLHSLHIRCQWWRSKCIDWLAASQRGICCCRSHENWVVFAVIQFYQVFGIFILDCFCSVNGFLLSLGRILSYGCVTELVGFAMLFSAGLYRSSLLLWIGIPRLLQCWSASPFCAVILNLFSFSLLFSGCSRPVFYLPLFCLHAYCCHYLLIWARFQQIIIDFFSECLGSSMCNIHSVSVRFT